MQTIVEVDSVYKSYGPSQVISHCSFKLNQGEIYGLLGVNGAGKTTLMKLILGLQKIDSGRILILGREADGSPGNLSEIGSIIETPVFYEQLNAEELLSMHLTLMDKKAHIPNVLRLVGLDPANKKTVSQYSLGMKQRLGLARAMIHRPKLLLLDEPLNGLDPVAIAEMRTLLQRLAGEGMTILLSSHIISELCHTSDRIRILSEGYIKEEFSVKEKAAEWGGHFEEYVVDFMRRHTYGTV